MVANDRPPGNCARRNERAYHLVDAAEIQKSTTVDLSAERADQELGTAELADPRPADKPAPAESVRNCGHSKPSLRSPATPWSKPMLAPH